MEEPEPPKPKTHTKAIVGIIVLAGLAAYNGVEIWQTVREKNNAEAQTQQNLEAAAQALKNKAAHEEHRDIVIARGIRVQNLNVEMDNDERELQSIKRSIDSATKNLERPRQEMAELRAKNEALKAKKQELEARLRNISH